jgi:hypothetical protein
MNVTLCFHGLVLSYGHFEILFVQQLVQVIYSCSVNDSNQQGIL